jgi:hypothetical protein
MFLLFLCTVKIFVHYVVSKNYGLILTFCYFKFKWVFIKSEVLDQDSGGEFI